MLLHVNVKLFFFMKVDTQLNVSVWKNTSMQGKLKKK